MMKSEEELRKLRKTKQELIKKGMQIRDQLIAFEIALKTNKQCITIEPTEPILLPRHSTNNLSPEKKFVTKLTATTRKITGIAFQDVDKTWLRDHVWFYEMTVILKVIQFQMSLTIDKKNLKENKILDIKCNFTNVDQCCLQEISPWVASLTSSKNFTRLMSAFSEYNDQSILRKRILNKLKNENIVTIEKCAEEGGGLVTFVHCPQASDKPYVKYCWRLQLNPQTTSIDHIFDIDGLDDEFVNANKKLLKSFCKRDLKKSELENLWCDLCIAINEYKQ